MHRIYIGGEMELQVSIRNIKRGYATTAGTKLDSYLVVIPKWAMLRSENYGVWYICHECAHVTCYRLFGHWKHDADFKTIEDMYLADFGLRVIRKKCYPKAILKLTSQEAVCYFN